jgi:N6-adenosine-specific RNA methylase IME4
VTNERQGVLWRDGRFSATASGLYIKGNPSLGEWSSALRSVSRAKSGVQWAIGDLMLFADGKGWSAEGVEEVLDATGLKRGTLQNIKSVAKSFPLNRRRNLPWSHHAVVASLSDEAANALLTQAEAEKWGWDELNAHAREQRHEQRRLSQAWPEGRFGIILADCPWKHEDGALPPSRATANHYEEMDTKDLAALGEQVKKIAAPDCVMYFWTTTAKLWSGEAVEVADHWGFKHRSEHVWVKDRLGLGYWVRNRHEHLGIFVRGNPVPPAEDRRPDSVIEGAVREHSRKPDCVYSMLEHCYPEVPKVELFARYAREGWAAWGNELLPEGPVRAVRVRGGEEAVV